MAISAGNVIYAADFTPKFKLVSTTSNETGDIAAGKSGTLSYNFSAPQGYVWVGLVACTLSNTAFVIRSFSDTQVVVRNMSGSKARCAASWTALYTNWGTGTCVATTAGIAKGNLIYANAVAPVYYKEYKTGTAYNVSANTNVNTLSNSMWTSSPAGMSPVAAMTCTTGHADTVLRGWTGHLGGDSIALYQHAVAAASGTPAQTRLFLKTSMNGSSGVTAISGDSSIVVNNLRNAWFIKDYSFTYSSLAIGGSVSRSASQISLGTGVPSGYKPVALAKIYTDNTYGYLQAFNPFASGGAAAVTLRNGRSDGTIGGSQGVFSVLYMSTNLVA